MTIRRTNKKFLLPVVFALTTVGCSSTPPPRSELVLAERAVSAAETTAAAEHAPESMGSAERKLAEARVLMGNKKYRAARQLLQQSAVDAELAAAASKARQVTLKQQRLQGEVDQLKATLSTASADTQ